MFEYIRSPRAFRPRPPRSLGRSGSLLAATIAFSLISIWLVFVAIAYETYWAEWRNASLYSRNVATLIERDISRTIELYDLSLAATSLDAENPDVMALPLDLRRKAIFDNSTNASGLGTLIILDKDGKTVADSRNAVKIGTDFSDRDYFTVQRDGRVAQQPFISHVFRSRVSGKDMIAVTRPLVTADGSFDGAVVGPISSDFLSQIFSDVELPPGSSVTLTHEDGTTLLRVPARNFDIQRMPKPVEFRGVKSKGTDEFIRTSSFDGVERLHAQRQVGRFPIYLTVGLSTRQILSHWIWRAQLIGLALVSSSAIILFLAWTLAQELERRAAAERNLYDLAATDSLTQLANRRTFDERLDTEWRRAARDATSLALLMIDGDFFKAFNDTYGHLEGDRALRVLAETLKRCVERPADLVARFGGEEFVVLLPNTGQDGANAIAIAMRQAITDADLPHATSPFGHVTVSIGVAVRRPVTPDGASDLIEAADAALYRAKEEGRDRIVLDGARPFKPAGTLATPSSSVA